MNQIVTTAVVLTRTNFGEADRIITFLTLDQGKVRVLAKGVRRSASKLAGGIELFSESNITFIRGRGEIGTLISTRLMRYYDQIVKNLDRTTLAYQILKTIHKNTEDAVDSEYYELLRETLVGLNDFEIPINLVEFWFNTRLLKLSGHSPNLRTDTRGNTLDAHQSFLFDNEAMAFVPHDHGPYRAAHVKLLRLGFSGHPLKILARVADTEQIVAECLPLVRTMGNQFLAK